MLFKGDFINEDKIITVLGVINDIFLIVTDSSVGTLVQEIGNLRNSFNQLLCLKNPNEEEAAKQDEKVNTKDEKQIFSCNKMKCFQDKKPFSIGK